MPSVKGFPGFDKLARKVSSYEGLANMGEASNWLMEYIPLAGSGVAILIAIFQYATLRPKTKLEIEKLKKEIHKLSEESRTNSDNISEIQSNLIEQLPKYSDEAVVYSNTSGNVGFDFEGMGGHLYQGGKAIPGRGTGTLSFLDKGIINVVRNNKEGRYEIYLRNYTLRARQSHIILKDSTDDIPRRLRVSCEARTLDGEHTIRFVMRNPETDQWIGKSITHHISEPVWRRVEAHFTVPPWVAAELRIDDESPSATPSTIQLRKFMVTQKISK